VLSPHHRKSFVNYVFIVCFVDNNNRNRNNAVRRSRARPIQRVHPESSEPESKRPFREQLAAFIV
jgi:hypothetical protein